jgi:uncharacterized protein YoxC
MEKIKKILVYLALPLVVLLALFKLIMSLLGSTKVVKETEQKDAKLKKEVESLVAESNKLVEQANSVKPAQVDEDWYKK